MEDSLTPKFGKYYEWCCPKRGSLVESTQDYEKPATEGRPTRHSFTEVKDEKL